mgnify:CR=1 FL=1
MASAAVTERCKKNKNLLEWLDSIILAVAVLSLVFTFAARASVWMGIPWTPPCMISSC